MARGCCASRSVPGEVNSSSQGKVEELGHHSPVGSGAGERCPALLPVGPGVSPLSCSPASDPMHRAKATRRSRGGKPSS